LCFVGHVTILFTLMRIANIISEHCCHGDEWCTSAISQQQLIFLFSRAKNPMITHDCNFGY